MTICRILIDFATPAMVVHTPLFFLWGMGGGGGGGAESFSKPVYYLTDIELTSCKYLLPNKTLQRRKPPLLFP